MARKRQEIVTTGGTVVNFKISGEEIVAVVGDEDIRITYLDHGRPSNETLTKVRCFLEKNFNKLLKYNSKKSLDGIHRDRNFIRHFVAVYDMV